MLKKSIFAIVPEFNQPGTAGKLGSGGIKKKSYRVYLPPAITKMRTGLSYEVGPTLGAILEKRAALALDNGSRQLFSYGIATYTIGKDGELVKKITPSQAFKYGAEKGKLTHTNTSDLPSKLVGENGLLTNIPELDEFGKPKLDEFGNPRYLPLTFNEVLQEPEFAFTMRNLRQSFSSYARKFAMELGDKYTHYPAVFQSRMKDVIKNSADAAHYFMFGHLEDAGHLAEFNEQFTQHLLKLMNSNRVFDHFKKAKKFNLSLSPIAYKDIKGGGKNLLKPPLTLPTSKIDESLKNVKRVNADRIPDSIDAFSRHNQTRKVREYIKAKKLLDANPKNTAAAFKVQSLLEEGTELLKKSNKPPAKGGSAGVPGKGTEITGKDLSLLGKAGKGASKALPFVGAGIGIGFATSAMAKDASEFAASEDESSVVSQMRQLGRAGAELASGFSPVPLDASLLNLLPGEEFLDRGYRSLGEIVAPTKAERQAYEERKRNEDEVIQLQKESLASIDEEDTSTLPQEVDKQMSSILYRQ